MSRIALSMLLVTLAGCGEMPLDVQPVTAAMDRMATKDLDPDGNYAGSIRSDLLYTYDQVPTLTITELGDDSHSPSCNFTALVVKAGTLFEITGWWDEHAGTFENALYNRGPYNARKLPIAGVASAVRAQIAKAWGKAPALSRVDHVTVTLTGEPDSFHVYADFMQAFHKQATASVKALYNARTGQFSQIEEL